MAETKKKNHSGASPINNLEETPATETRREVDPLGEKLIPKNAYFGIQTLRATEKFPVSGIKAPIPFIRAYMLIKKSAALRQHAVRLP